MTTHTYSDWWLAVDGQPTGPYSEAYLQTAAAGGIIRADQLVSPVGGTEWRSLSLWPSFQDVVTTGTASAHSHARGSHSPLDRILQPLFAWFLLIWSPLQLLGGFVSVAFTPARFLDNSPPRMFETSLTGVNIVLGIIFATLAWMGGLRLLFRKRDAAYWTTIGLVGEWFLGFASLLLLDFLQALVDPRQLNPQNAVQPGTESLGWSLLVFFGVLTAAVLEIGSLVWVWIRRDRP